MNAFVLCMKQEKTSCQFVQSKFAVVVMLFFPTDCVMQEVCCGFKTAYMTYDILNDMFISFVV